jgi:hypothetical protein
MLEIIDKTDESLILSLAVWCLGEMYPSSDVVINKLLSLICKVPRVLVNIKLMEYTIKRLRV